MTDMTEATEATVSTIDFSNPIEQFIETIRLLNLRSRAYAIRPLCGMLNASIIGALSSHLSNEKPRESSGIDGKNDAIAAAFARQADAERTEAAADREPRMNSMELAKRLVGLRDDILGVFTEDALDNSDLVDMLKGACSNPGETLKFMTREAQVSAQTIKALAEAIGCAPDEAALAAQNAFRGGVNKLVENSGAILDELSNMSSGYGVRNFAELPARYQAKLIGGVERAINNQIAVALRDVARGNTDALSTISLLKETQKGVKAWAKKAAQDNPDLAFEMAA
jgi:hypothetical protein